MLQLLLCTFLNFHFYAGTPDILNIAPDEDNLFELLVDIAA